MNITKISIRQLFGLFDYDIELNKESDLTILTGPNGYGKTTILNIIFNLFHQKFFYFQKLNFKFISIILSNGQCIEITKKKGKEKNEQIIQIIDEEQRIVSRKADTTDIIIDLKEGKNIIQSYIYNSAVENRLIHELERYYPIRRISPDLWLEERTGKQFALYDFLNENNDSLPDRILELIKKQNDKSEEVLKVLNAINIYLIKEQRLLKQSKISVNRPLSQQLLSFVNTIEDYAKELKDMIAQKQLEAYHVAQQLDSSFPKRLIGTQKRLTKEEFEKRFERLTKKQKQLQEFGISISGQDVTEYNDDTANVLTVYLEDSENKVTVYDELLSKINLFVNILNEKRFTFKSIVIDNTHGFYFKTTAGDILNLTDLSSGEQNEVVLFYELLFKTTPNTLILIDEPEISLHVIWQKAFVKDLEEIAKMKHIPFLIATHSPQIINDRWDLTIDLFALANICQ
ncbi:MAG: AAA family ATPase [Tannerellaceae bacterium]|jgi:predicted ATP-binding protein involved in virulence|nr:AAA family ATPase [Tannerellaceae bacterium]